MKKISNFLLRNKQTILFTVLFILVFFISQDLFARLGGAGGSSSSGGSHGDGIGGLIWMIIMFLPFPLNIIVIAGVAVGYYFYNKKAKENTIFNNIPAGAQDFATKTPEGLDAFKLRNPDFNEEEFKKKVEKSFYDLQYAWQDKNMSKVRKYISDGMYQRLNTQFKMMDMLEQKNIIENLKLKDVHIAKYEVDGSFDIIHVAVMASVTDKFVSEKYKSLNSGGSEEFLEYWSFLRKQGSSESDLYSTNNCPKCGGELPTDAGDMSKCEYCGAITNSGEFDWVLSEITQADDFIVANQAPELKDKEELISAENEDFCAQLIEDKASNGYLQIQTARVLKDPKILRRFVSDELFEKLSNKIEKENKFIYNRIFLNDVSLMGIMQNNNKNVLTISIKSSYQRVSINDGKLVLIDPFVNIQNEYVIMERDIKAGDSKGSLYAHACPSCGAPIGDTVNTKCEYCGAELNSTSNEWIITGYMSQGEYQAYYSQNAQAFLSKVDPNKVDGLYKVRDYAFNNVLIMIAADGILDSEELNFANKLAKKWGYNVNKIQGMFELAKNQKLGIRMPEDEKSRKKIYKLMVKAANVDGNVSPEEQSLLDSIKNQYNINE